MKIALIGYGKMGKAIEEQAVKRGHTISLIIHSRNPEDFDKEKLCEVDVAIEFTSPHSVIANLEKLFDNKIPTVCGTTGWLNHLDKITSIVVQRDGSLIHASNFSLGVNLFFIINEYAANLIGNHNEYKTAIKEIHHTAKLDAPSGTAISIANGIIQQHPLYTAWHNDAQNIEHSLPVISERIDPAPGTHIVTYTSDIDTISLSHEAHNRVGFALGAVIAAEWIADKKGVFTMRDLFTGHY